MKRALLIVGLGIGAAAFGAALLLELSRTDDAAVTATSRAESRGEGFEARSAAPAPTVRRRVRASADACDFRKGETFGVSYSSESTYELSQAAAPRGQSPGALDGTTTFRGQMTFEVLSRNSNGSTLLGRLFDVNEKAKSKLDDTIDDPFLARINTSCKIVGFAHLKSTSRRSGRALQVALYDLSFFVPRKAGPPVEVVFDTSVGKLKTAIGAVSADRRWIERSSVAYLETWAPYLESTRVVDGTMTVDRGAHQWFAAINAREAISGDKLLSAQTETVAKATPAFPQKLAAAPRSQNEYVWANLLPYTNPAFAHIDRAKDPKHKKLVAAMKHVSYKQAIDSFEDRLQKNVPLPQLWPEMAAYLDAHPESVPQYVNTITDDSFPRGWRGHAFLALSQAATPRARDALLGIYRSDQSRPSDRARASLGLVTRSDSDAFAEELLGVATSALASGSASTSGTGNYVARQSALHLGAFAGINPNKSVIVESARQLISSLSASAATPSEFSLLFNTVGNAADPSIVNSIEEWARHPDVDVRKHAPRALRRYKPDLVEDVIVAWLKRETSPDVKRELFNVIRHMCVDDGSDVSEAIMREALKHLYEDPLVLTRQSLVHILAPFVKSRPEVRLALRTQLREEFDGRSGLFSLVARYLPTEDVHYVLSTIDELKDQYGVVQDPPIIAFSANKPPPPKDFPSYDPTSDVTPPPSDTP